MYLNIAKHGRKYDKISIYRNSIITGKGDNLVSRSTIERRDLVEKTVILPSQFYCGAMPFYILCPTKRRMPFYSFMTETLKEAFANQGHLQDRFTF